MAVIWTHGVVVATCILGVKTSRILKMIEPYIARYVSDNGKSPIIYPKISAEQKEKKAKIKTNEANRAVHSVISGKSTITDKNLKKIYSVISAEIEKRGFLPVDIDKF